MCDCHVLPCNGLAFKSSFAARTACIGSNALENSLSFVQVRWPLRNLLELLNRKAFQAFQDRLHRDRLTNFRLCKLLLREGVSAEEKLQSPNLRYISQKSTTLKPNPKGLGSRVTQNTQTPNPRPQILRNPKSLDPPSMKTNEGPNAEASAGPASHGEAAGTA